MNEESLDRVRDQLSGAAETLADLAMDALREAIEGNDAAREQERRITRARRAVERAVGLLS